MKIFTVWQIHWLEFDISFFSISRILYNHRESVLEQYRIFESVIGNDVNAKNQFRLEIAKFIFSDPVTGYVSDSKISELNINPIIITIEKLSAKK